MEEALKPYNRVNVVVVGIRHNGVMYPMSEKVLFALVHGQPFPTEVSTFKSFVKDDDKFIIKSGVVGDRVIGVTFKLYQSGEDVMFTMHDDRHPNECPKSSVYVKLEHDVIELPL